MNSWPRVSHVWPVEIEYRSTVLPRSRKGRSGYGLLVGAVVVLLVVLVLGVLMVAVVDVGLLLVSLLLPLVLRLPLLLLSTSATVTTATLTAAALLLSGPFDVTTTNSATNTDDSVG
jgi:hypothetical protein